MSGDAKFLNPYTFVPAFPRDGLPEPLRDGPPPARDRLRPGCWTGRVGVTLTVETPLLLLDTARGTPPAEGVDGHLVYPVRLRDGRPHLPATSVKGMLRAAYEAVTNSRFGVFDSHDAPLGFRRSADYALDMVPVLVGAGGVMFRFQHAALKMYDPKTGESLYPRQGQEAPRHLERIQALIRSERGKATSVVGFARKGTTERLIPENGERLVEGIAYVTGPNIEGKSSERLFYVESGREPAKLPLARPWSELEKQWNDLIRDYRNAHDGAELHERRRPDGSVAGPGERVGAGPGQLAWSPHLYDKTWQVLRGGMLCYARLVDGRVDRLYPVLVPRDIYPVAPSELLHPSLAPAPRYDELSPADRVFGWVAPPNGSGVRPAAYRGRLRIGPVTCEQDAERAVERFGGDGLPLAILGRPKPQQGRFYLAESPVRPDLPVRDGTPKEKLYQPGQGLRGRKAYWHHAGLDRSQHWSEGQGKLDPAQVRISGYYREYRRSRTSPGDSGDPDPDGKRYLTEPPEQRDTQNRSIGGWVRRETTFRFTVEVHDLDDHELGALAWLLSLPQGHFHRLGFGRPLGFGSVRLDVDAENTELHSGAEYVAYYRDLSGTLPDTDGLKILNGARETFERMVNGVPDLSTVRDAMLAVFQGDPELPVHYPRTRPEWLNEGVPGPPDPRGRNYEWFTENEKQESNRIVPGRGRSLPRPVDPVAPLGVYPSRKGEDNTGGRKPPAGSSRRGRDGKGRGNERGNGGKSR
ncbi:TIGR03986 family type III CRISPR-associated RAMP protein [Streptosporangium sp. G11]|uniref:TIGR03986 family type III CRISPR-associated RAMP protein n=1 Tax=Streptosporangium sp. G11 TaxID=3436926 RepID=UPI003EB90684